jgi:hypothetical protein
MIKKARLVLRSAAVHGDGKPVRKEDAIGILIEAWHEPDPERQRGSLEQAMLYAVFGTIGQYKFKQRGDRRGRPSGSKAPGAKYDDSAALAAMMTRARTGETNLRELARQAIDAGAVPLNGAKRESVIRRLVGRCRGK